jgi:hypothetical protein
MKDNFDDLLVQGQLFSVGKGRQVMAKAHIAFGKMS